jgi:hypothetical protein
MTALNAARLDCSAASASTFGAVGLSARALCGESVLRSEDVKKKGQF